MSMRLVLSGVLLACLSSVALADVVPQGKDADPKSGDAKKDASLEQQLLDDLGADLLDDLKSAGGVKPPKGKPGKRPAKGDGDGPLDKKLLEDLDDLDGGGEDFGVDQDDDPFLTIGREMRKAGELIGERKSADETQQLQVKIVEQLDALIKRIRRQQKQQQSASNRKSPGSTRQTPKQPGKNSSGASGKTANKPSRDSTDRLGKGDTRRVDMAAMKKLMEDIWGSLPERARQEMLQGAGDEFLPKYELKIERYFRRLSEQRRDG